MPVPYLVLTANEEPLKPQNELNDRAQKGYRVAGIVPARAGIDAFIILEKEEGPAAGAIRQQAG